MNNSHQKKLAEIVAYYVHQILEQGLAKDKNAAEDLLFKALVCNPVDAEIIDACNFFIKNPT